MSDKSPSDEIVEFPTPTMRLAEMHGTLIHKVLPQLIIKSNVIHTFTFPHLYDHLTKDQAFKLESELSTFLNQVESFLEFPLIPPPDLKKE